MTESNRYAAAGRKGGRVSSDAKRAAVVANGRLGGRPPKFTIGERVRALNGAPAATRGRVGVIVGRGAARATFEVRFGDDVRQLPSWHLATAR